MDVALYGTYRSTPTTISAIMVHCGVNIEPATVTRFHTHIFFLARRSLQNEGGLFAPFFLASHQAFSLSL